MRFHKEPTKVTSNEGEREREREREREKGARRQVDRFRRETKNEGGRWVRLTGEGEGEGEGVCRTGGWQADLSFLRDVFLELGPQLKVPRILSLSLFRACVLRQCRSGGEGVIRQTGQSGNLIVSSARAGCTRQGLRGTPRFPLPSYPQSFGSPLSAPHLHAAHFSSQNGSTKDTSGR